MPPVTGGGELGVTGEVRDLLSLLYSRGDLVSGRTTDVQLAISQLDALAAGGGMQQHYERPGQIQADLLLANQEWKGTTNAPGSFIPWAWTGHVR